MSKHGLVSLVFWCLFVLYVFLALHSGYRLLQISGLLGDPFSLGIQAYTDWFSNFARATSAIFHFTMSTIMVVFSILFYKGRRFAQRIVLVTPWTVVVFTILLWLAGNLYRVSQGEAFIPNGANEFVVGGLLCVFFQMFVVAFLNSWVATSESVVRWIEIEEAARESMNRID